MTPTTTEHDPRWAAVCERDASADGSFVYAVRSTGVYCRPSCSARRARPANVTFHDSAAEAVRAGFRPCLRCRPDDATAGARDADRVGALCRFIEASDGVPSLGALAAHVGLSAHHTHRMFKAHTGLTPRAYALAHRRRRVGSALRESATVTRAIYDAGFGSSGRFYEATDALLGMTPTTFRGGGAARPMRFAIGECSLGAILVAATERGVCAILLGDDADALAQDLARRFPKAALVGADADFERFVATVVGLVERPGLGAALPLDIRGTAFQQRVWTALAAIPAGTTKTYAELAAAVGAPKAVRAVAAACAANALAVAIPCHRVVRTDGGLAGYRWGVERKQALLAREARERTTNAGGPLGA